MDFETWKESVDEVLARIAGVVQDELPDWLARDAYDDGVSPEVGAELCLESAGWYDEDDEDDYDDSMDGDHTSALASAGWGTDEDYGSFGG